MVSVSVHEQSVVSVDVDVIVIVTAGSRVIWPDPNEQTSKAKIKERERDTIVAAWEAASLRGRTLYLCVALPDTLRDLLTGRP